MQSQHIRHRLRERQHCSEAALVQPARKPTLPEKKARQIKEWQGTDIVEEAVIWEWTRRNQYTALRQAVGQPCYHGIIANLRLS